MAISPFYRAIRDRVGTDLLLMPGVAAVIRDVRGRILVQMTHDDVWSLPAGAIEPGEPPAQAMAREVLEETGLVVRPNRILAVVGGAECRTTYPNGDRVEYVVTVFECEIVGGALIDSNEETKSLHWFAPEDTPALDFGYPEGVLGGTGEPPFFQWSDDW